MEEEEKEGETGRGEERSIGTAHRVRQEHLSVKGPRVFTQ